MNVRNRCFTSLVFGALILTANVAWALGQQLGETKEELKLDYDVDVADHGTGRVTVNLIIANEGRLGPLESVDLVIPNESGSGYVDLSLSLATRVSNRKTRARVHLRKELAERAEIQLRTWTLDGKKEERTWYYHVIPIVKYMEQAEQKKE